MKLEYYQILFEIYQLEPTKYKQVLANSYIKILEDNSSSK